MHSRMRSVSARSAADAAALSTSPGATATASARRRWCASAHARLRSPGLPPTRASTSGGSFAAACAELAGCRRGAGGQGGCALGFCPALAAAMPALALTPLASGGAPEARSASGPIHASGPSGSRSPQPCVRSSLEPSAHH